MNLNLKNESIRIDTNQAFLKQKNFETNSQIKSLRLGLPNPDL
jgi:hypothetical protein